MFARFRTWGQSQSHCRFLMKSSLNCSKNNNRNASELFAHHPSPCYLKLVQSPSSTAFFHSSTRPLLSRFPTLQVRVTRRARIRHLRKQKQLKERLGSKYRLLKKIPDLNPKPLPRVIPAMASILAKHGHGGNMSNVSNGPSTSPSSSSLPAQLHPAKIKPSQLLKTLELAKISSTTSSSSSSTTTTTTNTSSKPSFSNIKDISPEQLQAAKVQRKADMLLDPASIPEVTPDTTPALPEWATTAQREKYTSVGGAVYGSVQANGPNYFAYSVKPVEAHALLKTNVGVLQAMHKRTGNISAAIKIPQQAEMVRRIIGLENASASQVTKFNRQRLQALFGQHVLDTGSSEVQAALATLKIQSMLDHLETAKKDTTTKRALQIWQSKRERVLKYLKRKDIKSFVETCKAIGVEPNSIRV